MSLLGTLSKCATRWPLARGGAAGWIGIDVGGHAVKLAQLQRRGEHWQFAARWLYDEAEPVSAEAARQGKYDDRLTALRQARHLFRGSSAAVAVSPSFTDLRTVEIPRGERHEMYRMIREELSADETNEVAPPQFDFWEIAPADGNAPSLARVAVLAARPQLLHRVCQQLARASVECRVWDGLPCALARAVALVGSGENEPVLALDLGSTSTLATLVVDGRPRFSRLLRGCGIDALTMPLRKELQLSDTETQHLLRDFGVGSLEDLPAASAVARTTRRLLAGPQQELISEIQRTLGYLGPQQRGPRPQRLWLFGRGALIRGLPELLAARLQLPVAPWKLEDGVRGHDDALFGVAAALSALAWEADACI